MCCFFNKISLTDSKSNLDKRCYVICLCLLFMRNIGGNGGSGVDCFQFMQSSQNPFMRNIIFSRWSPQHIICTYDFMLISQTPWKVEGATEGYFTISVWAMVLNHFSSFLSFFTLETFFSPPPSAPRFHINMATLLTCSDQRATSKLC